MLPIVTLLGCKDNTAQSTPEAVSEELAFNVLTLQYQANCLCKLAGSELIWENVLQSLKNSMN